MKNVNLSSGFQWAIILLAFQILLALGAYVTACLIYGYEPFNFVSGLKWIAHHPVFPKVIIVLPVIGFLFGAFGGLIEAKAPSALKNATAQTKSRIAWIFIILLIAAFVLLGLPGVVYVLRS
ncbi:hypothetical protein [Hyphococcus luteus]|uniref:Uncharacterized protein n=1 Tax=Hyphococcus luteus TaxID=2058213 RepID=A0A2S7K4R0_9PROT|nr:hypothetical protein [Marinicaulis flavus]PQA87495.1 hypothetical protein CW354_11885 [Marinicaulis flavus]